MTREEIVQMARESGMVPQSYEPRIVDVLALQTLERFAALVAAAEREACAKVCDATYYQHIGPQFGEVRHGIAACAAAIRARGEQR